eukprot:1428283-Prymnesium_polylepis.1
MARCRSASSSDCSELHGVTSGCPMYAGCPEYGGDGYGCPTTGCAVCSRGCAVGRELPIVLPAAHAPGSWPRAEACEAPYAGSKTAASTCVEGGALGKGSNTSCLGSSFCGDDNDAAMAAASISSSAVCWRLIGTCACDAGTASWAGLMLVTNQSRAA